MNKIVDKFVFYKYTWIYEWVYILQVLVWNLLFKQTCTFLIDGSVDIVIFIKDVLYVMSINSCSLRSGVYHWICKVYNITEISRKFSPWKTLTAMEETEFLKQQRSRKSSLGLKSTNGCSEKIKMANYMIALKN